MAPQPTRVVRPSPDLTTLASVTDDTIVTRLRERVSVDAPWSKIGNTVFLYVNRFNGESDQFPAENEHEGEPCLEEINNRITRYMFLEGNDDQSIVLLGESGSGKSVSRTNILKTLLELNGTLAEQCKQAQILLNPFVTSKTITSSVSSRMGSQVTVQYAITDDSCAPIGVKFTGYRLEQSRVSHVPPGERSFHIFYHLLGGMSSAEREHVDLKTSVRYRYLGHPSQKSIKEISDHDGFNTMKMAFKKLGFGRSDAANVCQVVAAIMHLGQLEFTEKKTDSADHCTVKNRDALDTVAAFLGVVPAQLEVMLAHKGRWVRKERVTLMLDPAGCLGHVDELARTLYHLVVEWLIESINDKLNREGESQKRAHVIDFPGFQYVSSTGSLEQLLTNVANEYLYNIFVNTVFKRNIELYRAEQVPFPTITFFDPAETLAGLTKRNTGLLAILDNQSSKNKTDANLLTLLEKRFESSDSIKPDRGRGTFIVNHYAGGIEYSIQNLMSANEESGSFVASDFLMLFAGQTGDDSYAPASSNPFVVKLFEKASTPAPTTARIARQQSLRRTHSVRATKPKTASAVAADGNALAGLVETIEGGRCELVLHIKSNDRRMKNRFDRDTVKMQVEAYSLPDAVKRIDAGEHSHHVPFAEFLSRYGAGEVVGTEGEEQQVADQIVEAKLRGQGWGKRDVVVGATGMFLSDAAFEALEIQRLGLTPRPKMEAMQSPQSPEATRNSIDGVNRNIFGRSESKLNLLDNAQSPEAIPRPGGKAGGPRPNTMFSEWGGVVGGGDMFSALPSQSNLSAQAMEKGFLSEVVDEVPTSSSRKRWMLLVWLLTWYIPDFALRLLGPKKFKRKDIRTAWREKLAINYLIWLACATSIFIIAFFGNIICPTQNVFTSAELESTTFNKNNPDAPAHVAIRGEVFDLLQFAPRHFPSIVPTNQVLTYAGKDASTLFPVQVSALCYGSDGTGLNPAITLSFSGGNTSSVDKNAVFHDFRYTTTDYRPDWYFEQMIMLRQNYRIGFVGYPPAQIEALAKQQHQIAILDGFVYDFSQYIAGGVTVAVPPGYTPPSGVNAQFMEPSIVALFQNSAGQDVTEQFTKLPLSSAVKTRMKVCMRNLFFVGKVDTRNSAKCVFARYILLVISVCLVSVIGVKFLAALQFGHKREPEKLDKFVIGFIPCYTEGEESMRKSIESWARMRYDDTRKLLFIVCDGMICGAGNELPTPKIVLDILGVDPDIDPQPRSYEALGEGNKQHNMAKVYSGLYEILGHVVPFVCVVKVGKPSEVVKPGNRGKRDSQLILMKFLNHVHFNQEMNPLELDLYHHIRNVIGVPPTFYEFLFMIDADTEVAPDSASRMIASFIHDTQVVGLCGETGLTNAKQSVITMIQVYEYWISHNMAKAFESLFGSVTCLPGCFSMYRITQEGTRKPLFVNSSVIHDYAENRVDYLHTKNLLLLGEDRYLTTLLLKHHPRFKTKFIRDARAWTTAPDQWAVFLSQRRRWINSTIHNFIALFSVPGLCGFCCFSMRFIVMLDLISTILQPVVVIYLGYIVYLLASHSDIVPFTSLLLLASIYGLQAIIFIVRRKWEMVGYLMIYILAIPIYSFALPLHAFWNMDKFSWGSTRVAQGEGGKTVIISDEGRFDPRSIPKRKWDEYQAEMVDRNDDARSEASSATGRQSIRTSMFVPTVDQRGRFSRVVDQQNFFDNPPSRLGIEKAPVRSPLARESFLDDSYVTLPAKFGGDILEMQEAPIHPSNRLSRPMSSALPLDRPTSMAGTMPGLPSDEQILAEIKKMLESADLMSVTKKGVKQHLEKLFGVPLDVRKEYINQCTEAVLSGKI